MNNFSVNVESVASDTKCCKSSGKINSSHELASSRLHRYVCTVSFGAENRVTKIKLITWLLEYKLNHLSHRDHLIQRRGDSPNHSNGLCDIPCTVSTCVHFTFYFFEGDRITPEMHVSFRKKHIICGSPFKYRESMV